MLFEVYIMFLKNVTLANIKKYKAEHTFEFENRSFINTISGKNGSGNYQIVQQFFRYIKVCYRLKNL